MVLEEMTIRTLADELIAARDERRTMMPLTGRIPLTMADAYRIQAYLLDARLRRGERLVGWKLGYTSTAMRVQMGVDQPNYGPLTHSMLLGDGDTADVRLIQPRVEPEIGFVLEQPLSGAVTSDQALAATGRALACIEVVDSVYAGYRFRVEDNTADCSSAAQVVVGSDLPSAVDLATLQVELRRNGNLVGTATGAAAMGHPAEALAWLARRQHLEPGHLVITGGLTPMVALEPGDTVSATFGNAIRVTVRARPSDACAGPVG